jgi:hypothetical protein
LAVSSLLGCSSEGSGPHRKPSNAHKAFLNGGFGDTIKAINGALECNGGNPGQVASRRQRFQTFCAALGVSPGAKDTGC